MQDLHKDSLQIILHNEILLDALRIVFYETIDKIKPVIKGEGDMELGQKYRAYETAKDMIDKSFINLNLLKVEQKTEKKFNKSR